LEPAPHNRVEAGKAAHRVIGRLLEAGVRDPSPEEILSFAAAESLLHERHVYRLAARQRLLVATAIYFRHFRRDSGWWRFLAFGVRVAGSDLDLVFEHVEGHVESDELKTGGAPALAERQALDRQIERQLTGALELYGRRYRGMRVLFLAAPWRSFFVSGDGARAPLLLESSDDSQLD
jgi:hypothetical protein